MSKAEIMTTLGALSAHVRSDPKYPGIDIRLERDGKSILLAWVEVDCFMKEPALKLRLYADCKSDEPTDDRTVATADLDEYFAGLSNGGTELI